MTETAKERSKRTFINYLTKYEWPYQISVFYQYKNDSLNAFEDSQAIRNYLRLKYRDFAFLWRLRLSRVDKEHIPDACTKSKSLLLPAHSLFCSKHTSSNLELSDELSSLLGVDVYVYGRTIDHKFVDQYAESVKTGTPDKLKKYIKTDQNIRRFSHPIGKKNLLPRWTPDSPKELYPHLDQLEARIYYYNLFQP